MCFLLSEHRIRVTPPSSAESRTVWIQCIFWCLGTKQGWHHPVLRTAELSGSNVFSIFWAPRQDGTTQLCGQQNCLDPMCFFVSGHQVRVAPPSSADSRGAWIQCVFIVWAPSKGGTTQFCGQHNCLDPDPSVPNEFGNVHVTIDKTLYWHSGSSGDLDLFNSSELNKIHGTAMAPVSTLSGSVVLSGT